MRGRFLCVICEASVSFGRWGRRVVRAWRRSVAPFQPELFSKVLAVDSGPWIKKWNGCFVFFIFLCEYLFVVHLLLFYLFSSPDLFCQYFFVVHLFLFLSVFLFFFFMVVSWSHIRRPIFSFYLGLVFSIFSFIIFGFIFFSLSYVVFRKCVPFLTPVSRFLLVFLPFSFCRDLLFRLFLSSVIGPPCSWYSLFLFLFPFSVFFLLFYIIVVHFPFRFVVSLSVFRVFPVFLFSFEFYNFLFLFFFPFSFFLSFPAWNFRIGPILSIFKIGNPWMQVQRLFKL